MNISNEKIRKIISLEKELFRDDVTTVENIAGLFPRGYLSIIASAPGVGKTWFMLYLTCQLSLGKDIFNSTHEPKKILILSGETGSTMLNRRLGKTNWGYEPSNIKIFDAFGVLFDLFSQRFHAVKHPSRIGLLQRILPLIALPRGGQTLHARHAAGLHDGEVLFRSQIAERELQRFEIAGCHSIHGQLRTMVRDADEADFALRARFEHISIKRNAPMSRYTTLHLGGPADLLACPAHPARRKACLPSTSPISSPTASA